jgi:hypothetical protein
MKYSINNFTNEFKKCANYTTKEYLYKLLIARIKLSKFLSTK